MTKVEQADLSRELALAIGWPPEDARVLDGTCYVFWTSQPAEYSARFDYNDPRVIWPIAERYNIFPHRIGNKWAAEIPHLMVTSFCDTAAESVARAVVETYYSRAKIYY